MDGRWLSVPSDGILWVPLLRELAHYFYLLESTTFFSLFSHFGFRICPGKVGPGKRGRNSPEMEKKKIKLSLNLSHIITFFFSRFSPYLAFFLLAHFLFLLLFFTLLLILVSLLNYFFQFIFLHDSCT